MILEPPSPPSRPPGRERPEPVRRLGQPFFDNLVAPYRPGAVRSTLHKMLHGQYAEADRINKIRGWGGAQPHGNDRYQYSLEQGRFLSSNLPGAEIQRPNGSLLYVIGTALIYPKRYGEREDDCPTFAQIDEDSENQLGLADGRFEVAPTLFDPDPTTPRQVVWLLFAGNHIESGPLAAFLGKPGGRLSNNRIDWLAIEPLLRDDVDPTDQSSQGWPDNSPSPSSAPLPSEPPLSISLRP